MGRWVGGLGCWDLGQNRGLVILVLKLLLSLLSNYQCFV